MDDSEQPSIPEAFCWTRFGTEAGETISQILRRKDAERCANCGTFFWGIGNSVAPGITELVRASSQPELLFSPIKGAARVADVNPDAVVRWQSAETINGQFFRLPVGAVLTSRMAARKRSHYALVCHTDEPLRVSDHGHISFHALRNLLSGRSVGSSQVTAVVRLLRGSFLESATYTIALRVRLVYPFFVRLRDPVPISNLPGSVVADILPSAGSRGDRLIMDRVNPISV
jgi:hypothetical protein